jgi:hypothetical protein
MDNRFLAPPNPDSVKDVQFKILLKSKGYHDEEIADVRRPLLRRVCAGRLHSAV